MKNLKIRKLESLYWLDDKFKPLIIYYDIDNQQIVQSNPNFSFTQEDFNRIRDYICKNSNSNFIIGGLEALFLDILNKNSILRNGNDGYRFPCSEQPKMGFVKINFLRDAYARISGFDVRDIINELHYRFVKIREKYFKYKDLYHKLTLKSYYDTKLQHIKKKRDKLNKLYRLVKKQFNVYTKIKNLDYQRFDRLEIRKMIDNFNTYDNFGFLNKEVFSNYVSVNKDNHYFVLYGIIKQIRKGGEHYEQIIKDKCPNYIKILENNQKFIHNF